MTTAADPHIKTLVAEGYTEREAIFLNAVAVHSGFFTVAQFRRFTELKAGKTSQRMVDRVKEFGHAVVAGRIDRMAEVLELSPDLCEALDTPIPRPKEAAERLLVLDYVIANQNFPYLPREEDKVRYFIDLGVPKAKLSRMNEHFFDERLPIIRIPHGAGFVWVDNGSMDSFEAFLLRHAALFNALKKAFVVFATLNEAPKWGAKRFETVMNRLVHHQNELVDLEECPTRSLGGPELRRLRTLRACAVELANPPFRDFRRFQLKHGYRVTIPGQG